MKMIISILAIIICTITNSSAQQGYGCAIVFFYDDAGNQVNREYFCGDLDNTGGKALLVQENNLPKPQNIEVSKITAIYPNPTTGIFSIIFSSDLKDATIQIIDLTGKIIQQRKITNTTRETFDISGSPAGTYFLRVVFNGKLITQKIIKQ
jgi:hypothetical protein